MSTDAEEGRFSFDVCKELHPKLAPRVISPTFAQVGKHPRRSLKTAVRFNIESSVFEFGPQFLVTMKERRREVLRLAC
jgi:hypothetical protein